MERTLSFWKSFALIMGMLAVLVASWEMGKADPVLALAAAGGNVGEAIPQQSIRLRILADSDAPADQALKRRVRDVVVASMNEWASSPRTLEEARAHIRSRLPELEALATRTAIEAGFEYAVQAELGVVPFPTKVYDGQLYPAGEYEALRITIGRGLGQNWWCVLFPPLCFVDIAASEKPRAPGASAVVAAGAVLAEAAAAEDVSTAAEEQGGEAAEVEYRFFLLEAISDAIAAVRGWFGHVA